MCVHLSTSPAAHPPPARFPSSAQEDYVKYKASSEKAAGQSGAPGAQARKRARKPITTHALAKESVISPMTTTRSRRRRQASPAADFHLRDSLLKLHAGSTPLDIVMAGLAGQKSSARSRNPFRVSSEGIAPSPRGPSGTARNPEVDVGPQKAVDDPGASDVLALGLPSAHQHGSSKDEQAGALDASETGVERQGPMAGRTAGGKCAASSGLHVDTVAGGSEDGAEADAGATLLSTEEKDGIETTPVADKIVGSLHAVGDAQVAISSPPLPLRDEHFASSDLEAGASSQQHDPAAVHSACARIVDEHSAPAAASLGGVSPRPATSAKTSTPTASEAPPEDQPEPACQSMADAGACAQVSANAAADGSGGPQTESPALPVCEPAVAAPEEETANVPESDDVPICSQAPFPAPPENQDDPGFHVCEATSPASVPTLDSAPAVAPSSLAPPASAEEREIPPPDCDAAQTPQVVEEFFDAVTSSGVSVNTEMSNDDSVPAMEGMSNPQSPGESSDISLFNATGPSADDKDLAVNQEILSSPDATEFEETLMTLRLSDQLHPQKCETPAVASSPALVLPECSLQAATDTVCGGHSAPCSSPEQQVCTILQIETATRDNLLRDDNTPTHKDSESPSLSDLPAPILEASVCAADTPVAKRLRSRVSEGAHEHPAEAGATSVTVSAVPDPPAVALPVHEGVSNVHVSDSTDKTSNMPMVDDNTAAKATKQHKSASRGNPQGVGLKSTRSASTLASVPAHESAPSNISSDNDNQRQAPGSEIVAPIKGTPAVQGVGSTVAADGEGKSRALGPTRCTPTPPEAEIVHSSASADRDEQLMAHKQQGVAGYPGDAPSGVGVPSEKEPVHSLVPTHGEKRAKPLDAAASASTVKPGVSRVKRPPATTPVSSSQPESRADESTRLVSEPARTARTASKSVSELRLASFGASFLQRFSSVVSRCTPLSDATPAVQSESLSCAAAASTPQEYPECKFDDPAPTLPEQGLTRESAPATVTTPRVAVKVKFAKLKHQVTTPEGPGLASASATEQAHPNSPSTLKRLRKISNIDSSPLQAKLARHTSSVDARHNRLRDMPSGLPSRTAEKSRARGAQTHNKIKNERQRKLSPASVSKHQMILGRIAQALGSADVLTADRSGAPNVGACQIAPTTLVAPSAAGPGPAEVPPVQEPKPMARSASSTSGAKIARIRKQFRAMRKKLGVVRAGVSRASRPHGLRLASGVSREVRNLLASESLGPEAMHSETRRHVKTNTPKRSPEVTRPATADQVGFALVQWKISHSDAEKV